MVTLTEINKLRRRAHEKYLEAERVREEANELEDELKRKMKEYNRQRRQG